ncbi:F-box/LRR-repeat protein 2 isoform X2 [Mucor ambiguus]|uniref:F-box/LRR-repeat protein 2 isoform X2 n=1 Tax=Mucor ambiguus TaxID=91626 RepID=A0A0C9MLN3_9FUNG|nr:F-box/LRR-repeat protein 2 isoform X2 [Mucor ambiguus]
MNRLVSYIASWVDFILYLYIHITSTINAVVVVAQKKEPYRQSGTTAEDVLLRNRRRSHRPMQPPLPQALQRNQRSSRKPVFDKIPNEILIIMLESLDAADLFHCSTVSKHWNDFVIPILWRSPIPSKPILSCLPSFAAMDKKHRIRHTHQESHLSPGFPLHIPRYGHAVKSLDLSQIASHVTDCTIQHIVRSCPQLVNLNLSHCRLITNEGLHYLGRATRIASQLQVLSLQNCRQITDAGLSHLTAQCHGLQTLHLGACPRITNDGIISLVTASGNTIRRLRLSDCSHMTGSTLHAIARLCGPRLEWLDIARTKAIRHTDLEDLVQHCPNLCRLNVSMKKPKPLSELRDQLNRTRERLFHLHEDMTQATEEQQEQEDADQEAPNPLNELIDLLNRFNIQANLTDGSAQHRQLLLNQQHARDPVCFSTVETITMHLKKLEHLNLSHWHCLNDKAMHMISVHAHCLNYLNLVGCDSVTKKGLKFLSDLCERKSTCITLTDLMISPATCHSYESDSSSSSSCSSSEGRRTKWMSTKKHKMLYSRSI